MSRKLDAILIPNHFINKVSIRYTRSEFDGIVPSYNINPNITRLRHHISRTAAGYRPPL